MQILTRLLDPEVKVFFPKSIVVDKGLALAVGMFPTGKCLSIERMVDYVKSGSGPFLIYLPGMEGTGTLFFRQEPQLSRKFTVICVTLRNAPSFTYSDLIEDVLKVYETENISKAIVVGESFGGTVALQFAIGRDERVSHLVLANTFSYFRHRVDLSLALFLLPLGFWQPGRWVRNFVMRQILAAENVDEDATKNLLTASFSHGYAASRQRLKLIQEHDVRERLSELKVPVTIIAGAKDRLLPSVREAQFLATQIPHARVIVLPDSGHTCFLTEQFSLAEILNQDAILSSKS